MPASVADNPMSVDAGSGRIAPAGGIAAPALAAPLFRKMCTDCGLSRTDLAGKCGTACQFIAPDHAALEQTVHGTTRDEQGGDALFFGPFKAMWRARLAAPASGAQWTGITTRIGELLLERGDVDAVLTVAPDKDDRWKPVPVIVTDPAAMRHTRGMRMGFAPLLALLEPAARAGHRRIAMIGVPCQVHALRAIERELGFERITVIGTPCSDNTTTGNFHQFLALLDEHPETISYLEFRADYRVELRFDDGRQRLVPFLDLPISQLPSDFFPLTCRTCVDYANSLADIVVGYMGGNGDQWLIVRNERGADLLAALSDEVRLLPVTSAGNRAGAVKGFAANTERAAGGLPLRRMPKALRPIVGWLMPRIGPRGLEFARARIEMKAVESILHLRRAMPRMMKRMIPRHVWALGAPYGLCPRAGETCASADSDPGAP